MGYLSVKDFVMNITVMLSQAESCRKYHRKVNLLHATFYNTKFIKSSFEHKQIKKLNCRLRVDTNRVLLKLFVVRIFTWRYKRDSARNKSWIITLLSSWSDFECSKQYLLARISPLVPLQSQLDCIFPQGKLLWIFLEEILEIFLPNILVLEVIDWVIKT